METKFNVEKKQKRLGLAPIASFEDMSDEVRQKMENPSSAMSKLPEIKEHGCNLTSTGAQRPLTISTECNVTNIKLDVHTPSTPRIDISRASSSSHHDSRDSSPENVFDQRMVSSKQVGTGTLQETCLGGFREDGALDLRSSTEELYFMEQEDSNNKVENRDQISSLPQTQISRRSPIIFKLEEHHQPNMYIQHQRKDSASSEVAALLSISGRTSRISSVGSQGSAVSRLSAISGVSRSPSPHRMLLETSFCGPKPVVDSICESTVITCDDSPAEILEQVLLSRKHDPTKAVLAEGIQIDLNESPKKLKNTNLSNETELKMKPISLEKIEPKPAKMLNRVRIGIDRKFVEKNDSTKPNIVGVMPSGTEYIRIKLKQDHLYNDKGLAKNERIVDEPVEEILKKPVSLNLNVNTSIQIERINQPESMPVTVTNINLKNHTSPKLVRYTGLTKEQESRSPSPAPVSISRKSSFCSLFKSKDTIISPDSPRDRSRSKSRDRGGSGSGFESIINSTPNKQKSVLAIFKPGSRKTSDSKSKTTSPVDAVDHPIREHLNNNDSNHLSQVEFRFKPSQTCAFPTTPQSSGHSARSRLRYYDADDGAIHIPLHTPPEEKDMSSLNESNSIRILSLKDKKIGNELPEFPEKSKTTLNNLPLSPSNFTSNSTCPRLGNNGDTIIIPLRASPKPNTEISIQDQPKEQVSPIDAAIFSNDFETSNWSIEVQRHSSQESQATVIATSHKLHETSSITNNNNTPIAFNHKIQTSNEVNEIPNYPTKLNADDSNIISSNTNNIMLPPATPNALTREKKQILFSTKIGSGSEEQIFSTQFSLSKTESLSSQISESTTIFEVPTPNSVETLTLSSPKPQIATNDELNLSSNRRKLSRNSNSEKVILRPKKQTLQEELSSVVEIYQEKITSNGKTKSNNRDSKYIENVDEIMEAQKKLTASLAKNKRDNYSEEGSPVIDSHSGISPMNAANNAAPNYENSILKGVHSTPNHETNNELLYLKQSVMMTPATSSDYHGSSESEKESENGSSTSSRPTKSRLVHHHHHHHARSLGSTMDDHESAGLVSQQSFDEDLPYIPTTLPEERARGVSLIPVKERINMEIKMCPVERPRSTTPINPASLEEYCGAITNDDGENLTPRAEKLRISLPRRNSKEHDLKSNLFNSAIETKSPRRISSTSSQKTWFDFAAKQNNISTPKLLEKDVEEPLPPPLPPRRVSGPLASGSATTNPQPKTSASSTQQWINFEEIPEKRKIPKKITTLPAKEQQQSHHHNVQYSFVNPEDCQCECHENEKIMTTLLTHDNIILEAKNQHRPLNNYQVPPEDIQPLLQPDHSDCLDRASDSSVDYSYGGCQLPIDTCTRQSHKNDMLADKPFGIDLSVNIASSSSRSSTTSQELQSPYQPQGENIDNSIFHNSDIAKCTRSCSPVLAKSKH